jgi:predicted phage tail component-like protein
MSLRTSLFFNFDGIDSNEMGIYNVNINNGMLEESFIPNRSIRETKVKGNHKPYFHGVEYEPLELELTFAFDGSWDISKVRQVARWLCQDSYKPLYFSENPNRIYYVIANDDSQLIHNGLMQGYLTIKMRCDSPFSYSQEYLSVTYDFSSNPIIKIEDTQLDFSSGTLTNLVATTTGELELSKDSLGAYISTGVRISPEIDLTKAYSYGYINSTISWTSLIPTSTSILIETSVDNGLTWQEATNGQSIKNLFLGKDLKYTKVLVRQTLSTSNTTVTPQISSISIEIKVGILFENYGDTNISPELWIYKVGIGDVSLINHTKSMEVFKFSGLVDAETVYIDNENEQIETDIVDTYRYNNFNNQYLDLITGLNILEVVGNGKFRFRTRFKTLQG